MFRFDHDVNRQGVGSLTLIMPDEPRVCETTPIERVAAPMISWACDGGLCFGDRNPGRKPHG